MIQLTFFETTLKDEFQLSDRDSRRMARAVTDISETVGMSLTEVFDFIKFGCEEELKRLDEDYDWNAFYRSISFRLKKQEPD